MINIKRIKVDGFKNIDKLDIELDKVNVFVSTNNYGKSNLLQSIDFGFEFIGYSTKMKSGMMQWKNGIPLNIHESGKNYAFEFEFSGICNGQEISAIYGFEFSWQKGTKESSKIVSEYLKIRNNDESQKYMTCIERNLNHATYRPSLTGRCDKLVNINDNELVINKVKAYDNLFYIDIIEQINDVNVYVDRHFDAGELYDVTPIIRKNVDNLSPFSDNAIARTLFYLKKDHRKKFDLIINTIKDLFPYIADIIIRKINLTEKNFSADLDDDGPFEVDDYAYFLVVSNKHLSRTVTFSLMSDGAKRILLSLTYMTLADLNNIPLIGLEEPENSIHPSLLKKYMDIVDTFLENSKVIITSHSPYLINHIKLTNLYVGRPNEFGIASFGRIRSTAVQRINGYALEMGIQAGEYLFSVMSGEDEFDLEVLEKYLESGK